jgi:hypothetical protein
MDGARLDQTRLARAPAEWNLAARLGHVGELAPMRALLTEAVRPSRALAFEKLPQPEALARHPELQGAYDGLRAMRVSLAERFQGNALAQERFYAQARSEVVRKLDSGQLLGAAHERGPAGVRARVGPVRETAGDTPKWIECYGVNMIWPPRMAVPRAWCMEPSARTSALRQTSLKLRRLVPNTTKQSCP